MINIENEIFTQLKTKLTSAYSGIYVTGEYSPTSSTFPCVFIEESDNFAISLNGANSGEETGVMYEINIFSDLADGAKNQCKNIAQTIDEYMSIKGFRRTMLQRTPNLDDSIYRITARYTASVYNNTIYRR